VAGILNKGYRELQCKDNLSGVKNIYLFKFVPYFYTSIQVNEGLELISYPATYAYKYELRGDYSLNQSLNDEGEWTQSIEVELKKIDIETTIELNRISRNLVGCIVEYQSGLFALMGLRGGCEMSLGTKTGSTKSEFSGYTLSIDAIEEYQAPLFESLQDVGFIPIETEAFLLQENGSYILQENDFKIRL
jgi:hypothetical protein